MSASSLAVVGISHRTAPLAERERFALARPAAHALLERHGSEALLLVTCNRTELYVTGDPVAAERALRDAAGGAEGPLFTLFAEDAARHLLMVAAGLDSMVIGEPQILGQVKRAMADARAAGTLGPLLDALSRRALTVGRRVRRETAVGRGLPSIPKVATGVARLVLGDLASRSILVLGTGKVGDLTARSLGRAGAVSLLVANRSPEPAAELAAAIGGRPVPWDELDRCLVDVDIVLACTGAAAPVLTLERLARVTDARGGRQLVLLDIAVPRDAAPEARTLPGIRLYDLDDLRGWSSDAVSPAELDAARAIVDAGTDGYLAWAAARRAAPTIQALRERAESILANEVERTSADADPEVLRAFGRRLLGKLLHHPMKRLKDGAVGQGDSYVSVARELFDLDRDNGGPGG